MSESEVAPQDRAPRRARGRQPSVDWTDALVADLARERQQGATLSALASRLGVSRERVRQILALHGHADLSTVAADVRQESKTARDEADRDRIRTLLTDDPYLTWVEVADLLGVTRSRVLALVGPQERALRRSDSEHRRKFSDEDMKAALQVALRDVGRKTLTYAEYASWSRRHEGYPSAALMTFRFGSWSLALKAAALPANPARRKTAAPRLSDSDLVGWVALALRDGASGTAAGYDVWALQQAGAPSASLVRHRLGWTEARRRAEALNASDEAVSPARVVSKRSRD